MVNKPRMVFFQFEYSPALPEFLIFHKLDHVKSLSLFFDVTVIDHDCDYDETCDKYQPDLTLFESGVPNPACRRPNIRNTRTHAKIPKLGLLNADGFCCGREGFLSDMDHWGIEWYAAIATSAPEHMKSIADRLFIWPNSVDPRIYRDYGQWKSIPVLFTGNKNNLYPWRRSMIQIIPDHFPAMLCPHPGYAADRTPHHFPVGEAYARTLNSAWFVPACGSVAKEAVRKHFEVPACASCLVTEESPVLKAAGFADMVNCVFAEPDNVVEKLSSLFAEPERLRTIIDSGRQLVMARHTHNQRNQILQWYRFQRGLSNEVRIVQPNPFGDLSLSGNLDGFTAPWSISGARHLSLLRDGDEHLRNKQYATAEMLYLKCLDYVSYMPEAQVRLAICNLHMGRPSQALSWITEPLQFTLAQYRAADPDPVEWAYFIVAQLCLGNLAAAVKSARDFSSLSHPRLDWVRRVVAILGGDSGAESASAEQTIKQRSSIHLLPEVSFESWMEQLELMLTACGQNELADFLRRSELPDAAVPTEERSIRRSPRGTLLLHPYALAWNAGFRATRNAVRTIMWQSRLQNTLRYMKIAAKNALYRFERKTGYILPYRLSAARFDDPFRSIEQLAQARDVQSILIVGARKKSLNTAAVLSGASHNTRIPTVICLSSDGAIAHTTCRGPELAEHWFTISRHTPRQGSQFRNVLCSAKSARNITAFDLVCLEGADFGADSGSREAIRAEMSLAGHVVLGGISLRPVCDFHHWALRNSSLTLIDQDPDLRNGFSIFAHADTDFESLSPTSAPNYAQSRQED